MHYVEYPKNSLDVLVEKIEREDWAEECRSIKRNPVVLRHSDSMMLNELYYKGINEGDKEIIDSIWGPEREMYSGDDHPDFVTLNSEISSEFGDERFFVGIKEYGTEEYHSEIVLEQGKMYEVRILYHNNASNRSNKTGYGMANDLRASVLLPVCVFPGECRLLTVALNASTIVTNDNVDELNNARVWSGVKLYTNDLPAFIQFIYASATIENKGNANGAILPTTLFSEKGTPLGYNKLAGALPGGAQYAGYVHFSFQVLDLSESK